MRGRELAIGNKQLAVSAEQTRGIGNMQYAICNWQLEIEVSNRELGNGARRKEEKERVLLPAIFPAYLYSLLLDLAIKLQWLEFISG